MHAVSRYSLALSFATIAALASCKTGSTSQAEVTRAEISNELTATAEVVAVERSERRVTLRREDGSLFELQAGEAVRNYGQIAVGDALRVRYKETLSATLQPEGEGARAAEGALVAGRTPVGARPGAGVGVAVSVSVTIESLDKKNNIVVFSLASGELIARRVMTSEGRSFMDSLKLGDNVRLDYTEAMALSVEEL